MELPYAVTNNDSGIIVFAITFLSIIFLGSLAFTIFMPRIMMNPPPKLAEPSDEIYISWGERRFLGVQSGTEPNLAARVRALRARQRFIRPIAITIIRIIGVIITIVSAIFLILALSAFFPPQFWLTRVIVLNYSLLGPYIFLPIFILLGVLGLTWMIVVFRLLGNKDIAPIRLKNETEKILKVFIRGNFISTVQPGTEVENKKVPPIYDVYLIKAKDESGNLFYFKEFNLDELDALDWKIVIDMESHNP
jgi:hypothetical protein